MKKIKDIIGCGLILCGFIGIIICAIAGCVFAWSNPDMTEMRRFLEYPWPTVWIIVDYIGIHIGLHLIKKK
jgi:hypothetical protein